VPGPAHPVSVALPSHGVASIRAADDLDAFLALGYLHARFRLAEMDLERRLGEGRIAQLAGPAGLDSDKFELRLGLLRTARAEWAATPRTSPAGRTLLAYSPRANHSLRPAPAAPARGPPPPASPASTRPPGPRPPASSSRASSPRSSTTRPPRSTTRSSNAPSAGPTPWPGSPSSPPPPSPPTTPAPTNT